MEKTSGVRFKVNRPAASPNDRPKAVRENGTTRSPRRRVVVDGIFHSLTGTFRIGIKNLSCTGALIQCGQALQVGKEGVLQGEHIDHFCRIVWTDGSFYGLQFDEPLPMDVVLELHRITGEDVERAETKAAEEWWRNHAP
jgi:hypothetical protein